MRYGLIVLMSVALTGCATRRPVVDDTPPAVVLPAALPTKAVETRYDVRGYREAARPSLRHEAHAVYRRSRIPLSSDATLETVSRTEFPPASYEPLPASEELAAELAAQRTISADLRAVQASIVETEKQVQAHYAALVRQSAETLKLREQLEIERARLRTAEQAQPATVPEAPDANPSEVKW